MTVKSTIKPISASRVPLYREPMFLDKEQKQKNLAEKIKFVGRFFEAFDWLLVAVYVVLFFRLVSFRFDLSLLTIIILALSQSLVYHRFIFEKLCAKEPKLALKIDIAFVMAMMIFLVQLAGGVISPVAYLYIVVLAIAAFAINPYSVFGFLLTEYVFVYFSLFSDSHKLEFVSNNFNLFFWEIVFLSFSAILFFVLGSLYFSELKFHSKLEYFSNQLVADKVKSEAVLESMSDGVVVVDAEKKILFLNDSAMSLLKVSNSEKDKLLNREYTHIFKFELDGNELDYTKDGPMELAISTNKSHFRRDLSLKTGYKDPLFVAISSAPVVDASGNVQGAVAVLRDITKEREIERLQNEFVSIASHELLTPITQVQGHLSMIVDEGIGKMDDTAQTLVNNAYGGIQRIGRLVKDLMHVSQIERETMKMNLDNIDIVAYSENIVKDFQKQAEIKGLYVKFDKPKKNISKVLIDPDHLMEVYNNLIVNALKFTKEGGVTVSLMDKKTGFVEISITDTGVGIPKQEIPKLFTKFYQVDSSATREAEGTGLGLYICKKMIEMMGGEIRVESTLNKGSSFIFSVKKAVKK